MQTASAALIGLVMDTQSPSEVLLMFSVVNLVPILPTMQLKQQQLSQNLQ